MTPPEDTPSHVSLITGIPRNRPPLITGRPTTASTHSLHSQAREPEGYELVVRTRADPEKRDRQVPGDLRRKTAVPENENGGPLTLPPLRVRRPRRTGKAGSIVYTRCNQAR